MAQQDGGWPLGLRPLSQRVGLTRNWEFSGSSSFSTQITGSPRASSVASSDFDSESAGSFFHDQRITLGSLIGISNFVELSFRSLGKSRRRETSKGNKCNRAKTCFSLCLRGAHLANEIASNAPSLGHYLEVERGAGNIHRSQSSITYQLSELTEGQSTPVPNAPFSSGSIDPSRMNGDVSKSRTRLDSCDETRTDEADRLVSSLLLPCMGGRSQH